MIEKFHSCHGYLKYLKDTSTYISIRRNTAKDLLSALRNQIVH